jgi:hypothetical protein
MNNSYNIIEVIGGYGLKMAIGVCDVGIHLKRKYKQQKIFRIEFNLYNFVILCIARSVVKK